LHAENFEIFCPVGNKLGRDNASSSTAKQQDISKDSSAFMQISVFFAACNKAGRDHKFVARNNKISQRYSRKTEQTQRLES
jgi:hypothetical protein